MSGQTKQGLRALFLFIPTIALCAIVVNGMIELENAPTVRLPIAGYDPVDFREGVWSEVAAYLSRKHDNAHI